MPGYWEILFGIAAAQFLALGKSCRMRWQDDSRMGFTAQGGNDNSVKSDDGRIGYRL